MSTGNRGNVDMTPIEREAADGGLFGPLFHLAVAPVYVGLASAGAWPVLAVAALAHAAAALALASGGDAQQDRPAAAPAPAR